MFYGRHKVLLAYLGNGIVNKYRKVLRPMSCSCTNPTVEFLWVFCAESRHPVTKAVISFYANDSMQHSVVGMKLHDIVRVCRQGRSAWGKVSKRRRGVRKREKKVIIRLLGGAGGWAASYLPTCYISCSSFFLADYVGSIFDFMRVVLLPRRRH